MHVMILRKKSMSFNYAAICTVGKNDYRVHFWDMTKSETMNRLNKLI